MNHWVKRVLWTLVPFIVGVALIRIGTPARVTVTWETASEVDAAGFRLFRSENPEGPFTLRSTDLIVAEGDPLVGAEYRFEDTEVIWGKRYYYQLEELTLSGSADRYSQTVAAMAGLGWHWALGAGAILGLVGFFTGYREPRAAKSPPESGNEPWTSA